MNENASARLRRRRRRVLESQKRKEYRVLLPLSYLDEARAMLPLGEMIAKDRNGELIILCVATVPEGESLSSATRRASRFREGVGKLLKDMLKIPVQIHTIVRTPEAIWDGILETVDRDRIDLMVLCCSSIALAEATGSDMENVILTSHPFDIVAVSLAETIIGPAGWKSVERILLPARGGMSAGLTLRIGNTLAQTVGATITLLHVTSDQTRQDDEAFFDEFIPALYGLETIGRSVTRKGEIPAAIVDEAREHDVVVMGAPSRRSSLNQWSRPLLDKVLKDAGTTVLVVREARDITEPVIETQEPDSIQIETPVAVVVDKWFAENTYRSREFADLERLLNLKESQGVTISLGLPALNEAETVGNVIQVVKSALMDDCPLLDEIVLIDSSSLDNTREIAADLGIPVYIHQEILPQYGAYHGKGEALWKSLYVLNGDIVVWIDTDIHNIHPRFVYGVLGPLLRDQRVQYVKGFYRRPLRQGDKIFAGGGGRVTELTARPLINLFYPELSGLVQPLSGEYAGRRHVLERLSFYSSYGVETGLLLDILKKFGLRAIAQVDLQERIHHNQPLPSLSKMSFEIMQVIFKSLEMRTGVELLRAANTTMNLIRYERRRYFLEPEEIVEIERPPIVTLPEYRKLRGIEAAFDDSDNVWYGEDSWNRVT
ncbi:MAG: glucosyl-3-phosphoglycerate synthase [Anaerolineales bacterium]|nr:glucosyl-3-phosphoglycerate synthase [Anaerolineales bacterium]